MLIKCDITDTLPHGAAAVNFQSAQRTAFLNDRSAEHDVVGITAGICTTLENPGNISNKSSIVSSISDCSHVA